ncbi:hypothetical protein M7I_6954 [Glarea lozoyensis 74030]|uniref:Uncharacterized protein n=1 Tax=Glarea lozoyensis (strain ATCC 74030 / MF5533) TaxID=1104152 RepID=H0EVZ6_GLAL7|nr:hypothetical protein M7I_6954 [Glarea lozoyensis 74030]
MKGLRDLRVKLNFVQYSASILCLESSFLDPIKEVTAPDVFETSTRICKAEVEDK